MSKIEWLDKLGWSEDQLEDLRFTGFAYIRQGKYDIALSIFEALAVLDPKSAYDAQTLGALYLQMGKNAQALSWFEKALTLEKDHAPTLMNLAKTFLVLGRKQDAMKVAQILKTNPDRDISSMARALLLAYGEVKKGDESTTTKSK